MKKRITQILSCRRCGNSFALKVGIMDYLAWEDGKLIQDAMPYLSKEERELLVSGTCGECFDAMFAISEEA